MAERRLTNNIRTLRFLANEMTQAELGQRVGLTRQTIAAVEAGKYSANRSRKCSAGRGECGVASLTRIDAENADKTSEFLSAPIRVNPCRCRFRKRWRGV